MEKMLEKVGNTTINNIKQTNNIHINNYGKEDYSYITDTIFTRLLCGPYMAIPNLVNKIHFHPKHLENRNIRIPNKKMPFAEVYNNEKWEIRDKKDTITELVRDKLDILDEKFERLEGNMIERKVDNYGIFQDKMEGESLIKRMEKECMLNVLNGSK